MFNVNRAAGAQAIVAPQYQSIAAAADLKARTSQALDSDYFWEE